MHTMSGQIQWRQMLLRLGERIMLVHGDTLDTSVLHCPFHLQPVSARTACLAWPGDPRVVGTLLGRHVPLAGRATLVQWQSDADVG